MAKSGRLGDRWGMAVCLTRLADVLSRKGQFERAMQLMRESIDLLEAIRARLEKKARDPSCVEAPTARPVPPRPFEPTGCSSAAGYSTGFPIVYSFPTAATTRTLCCAA